MAQGKATGIPASPRDDRWNRISLQIRELLIEELKLDKPGRDRPNGLKAEDIPVDEKLTSPPVSADSLDLVESMMAFEDKFKIEIPSEDEGNLASPAMITDYLIHKGLSLS